MWSLRLGETDEAVRDRRGFGAQAGVFALDIEVADFTVIEYAFIETGPQKSESLAGIGTNPWKFVKKTTFLK